MFPRLSDTEMPTSEEALLKLEKSLRVRLPAEYRQFLLLHNGGRPTPSEFRYAEADGPYSDSVVDWFLAVYDGASDNFERYFYTYKIDAKRMPDSLVPIAHDPGGNLICISVAGPKYGAVYFWDHDLEADTGEVADFRNVYLIADSFNEFLDKLY